MKILKLEAENVKRLTAVTIEPSGALVLIGGKNSSGKTSTLDSIAVGLLGADAVPDKPVRRGQSKAKVRLELGEDKQVELVVQRTMTAAGGNTLKVTDPDGKQFPGGPQTLLNELYDRRTIDLMEFITAKPAEQAATLRQLVGLDFTALDKDREALYNERTTVNRDVAALKSRLQAMPDLPPDLPQEEISTVELANQQAQAARVNQLNAEIRQKATEASRLHKQTVADHQRQEERVRELQNQLEEAKVRLETRDNERIQAKANSEHALAEASKCEDVDLSTFQAKMQDAESTNYGVRAAKSRAELRKQLADRSKVADGLTDRIEQIDGKKREAIANAKYPVEGLGFDELGNLTLNGLPFAQAGTREQIQVSVAVGLALNKKLKVLLIRRGSEVDEEGLKIIAEMAEKAHAQVWMEVVREAADVSVVIEDGHVKGQARPTDGHQTEQQEMGITP